MEIAQIRMHVESAGSLREHVVVDAAPIASMVTELMVDMWRDGLAPHVRMKGDRVTFGTPNQGLGVVTYEVGPRIPTEDIPEGRRMSAPWRLLGRVA